MNKFIFILLTIVLLPFGLFAAKGKNGVTIPADTLVNKASLPQGNDISIQGGFNREITTYYPYGASGLYENYTSPSKTHITGSYIDGFNNLRLNIELRSAPNHKNLVAFSPREAASKNISTSYLPFVQNDAGLQTIYTGIEQKQLNYYSSPPSDIATNPYPLSQTKELLSVSEQGGTGAQWQLLNSAIPNSGHTQKIETAIIKDSAPGFVRWKLTSNGIDIDTGTGYDDNRIIKQIFKGADWVSGKTGTKETYTDQYGKLLMERSYLNETIYSETSYVYDEYDRLCAVVPPNTPYQQISEGDGVLEKYLYLYRYNEQGLVSQVKFPQKGWSYIIYDKFDRPLLTQDALLREKNHWTFNKYDQLGRPVVTGIFESILSYQQLTNLVNSSTSDFEKKDLSSTTGYTSLTYPTTDYTVYNVLYYDSYDEIPADNPFPSTPEPYSKLTQGLPLASKKLVLGTNTYLWNTLFYDKDQRPFLGYEQNNEGGFSKALSTYDYAGLLQSTTSQHLIAGESFEIRTRYEYDHRGRLMKEYIQINQQPEFIKSAYSYNELGYPVEQKIHSTNAGTTFLQSQQYSYSQNGQLKAVNNTNATSANQLFAYELLREDATFPRYDGKIGGQKFKTYGTSPSVGQQPDFLTYAYDGLDRLTAVQSSSAGVATGAYNESFEYDLRGNITKVGRYAALSGARTRIDSLHYSYDHNLHSRIDNIAAASGVGFSELSQADNEYRYNSAGQLVADDNKGINQIKYNAFGFIDTVIWNNGDKLVYTYTGSGERLRKDFTNSIHTLSTYYIAGVQYSSVNNGTLQFDFAKVPGGRLRKTAGLFKIEYDLTDHLGNTRLTFDEDPANPGQARILQYNSFYAFGGAMPGLSFVSGQKNKYLYNGKELQEETGLYDYGFRMYDPAIGRWHAADPLSDNHYGLSPYNYVMNNPLSYIDPLGLDTIDIDNGPMRLRVGTVVRAGSKYITITKEFFDFIVNRGIKGLGYIDEVTVNRYINNTGSTAGNAAFYNTISRHNAFMQNMLANSAAIWDNERAAMEAREQAARFNLMMEQSLAIKAKEKGNELISTTIRVTEDPPLLNFESNFGDKLKVDLFSDFNVKKAKAYNSFKYVLDPKGIVLTKGVSILSGTLGAGTSDKGFYVSTKLPLQNFTYNLSGSVSTEGYGIRLSSSLNGSPVATGANLTVKPGGYSLAAAILILSRGAMFPAIAPILAK
ncbi:RHS repeat-associated core domain-containing protein [Sphingobacterium spiritivorum]|uniref:RHS repeat-associated core domain protein n=1 Tax=Sphingobacterium spiritivorum ATCC 33861 TaxID=525373 RepID=D7VHU3_SPHSI|nr:RHS repeat-associated core domain-containing protein [Sphingobacterium spiritivorum]EFK59645.1 RHS repeat-associated core domain protein [Sphingobacterium spiritivorum ATCC 33861]QQT37698.1 RHS repeat-associated core domain-containing protein [Sphingobacterium spiritivorum]WQD34501.1 RHS repeat-associated core domain-containing protein [Sphingobacterium spiritivorum]SUI97483.1 RHS repeat-associated core domain [Sphingobacterium spiritivorum]